MRSTSAARWRGWGPESVAAVAVLAFTGWLIVGLGGPHATQIVDDTGTAVAALIAVGACLRTAWRSSGRARWAWGLLTAACASWAVAEITWGVYELVLKRDAPFPSLADVWYVTGVPLAVVAVWVFSIGRRSITALGVRAVLDGMIVAAALLLVSWVLILRPTFDASSSGSLEQVLSLLYPIGDVVTLTVVIAVLVRSVRGQRSLVFIGLALVAMALADSLYAYLAVSGTYDTGNVVDAGWMASYLLFALGARAALVAQPERDEADDSQRISVSHLLLPYAVLAPAGLVALYAFLISPRRDPFLGATATAIVLLVIVRQLITLLDNRALNRTLRSTVEQLQTREAELRHLAFHDSLTNLANRTVLQDRITSALDAQARDGRLVGVMMLDLDDFKTINDSLGHQVGDDLLIAVAQRLCSSVRPSDTVARLGGDEFAILAEDLAGEEDGVHRLTQRIIDAFSEPFSIAGRRIPVTASLGISYSTPDSSPDELLRNADLAMYAAKQNGKARCVAFAPEMRAHVVERLELRADLRGAADRGELVVLYQPIVDLYSGQITGMEALLRWQHPTRGLLGPEQFVPLAEETDEIFTIGRFVIDEACTRLGEWRALLGGATPDMHVNFSTRQFDDAHIASILDAITGSGADPAALVFEITEGAILEDTEPNLDRLRALKRYGSRIALDDFGTGYSSLSYLTRLPIDILKIDRSFVHEIEKSSRTALARGIIDLAHSLDLTTVAEGVASEGQLAVLQMLGCDQGQGFLFAKAVAPDEAIDLLRRPHRIGGTLGNSPAHAARA